jgi:hypothetical protein
MAAEGSLVLFTPWPLDTCSWSQVLQILEARPLSQSGLFAEDKSILCPPGVELYFLDPSTNRQMAIPTELSRLMPQDPIVDGR